MKIRQEEQPFLQTDPLTNELFSEDAVFFDIETTGFSPRLSQLYLIGCATRSGDTFTIHQFFAEHMGEEEAILQAFFEVLSSYRKIISYNGVGFDIPYLKGKCEQFGIAEPFDDMQYIDMFKSVSKIRHILNLPDYKQKSIEHFLHLTRKDTYSGGELIPIYESYTRTTDEAQLALLLLHNYEDVTGMIRLLPILSYTRLFSEPERDLIHASAKLHTKDSISELAISASLRYALPQTFDVRIGQFQISVTGDRLELTVPLTDDALKYFYPNYKDYYYLPLEDTAMHKSVASYVDKAHRKQATASTCYTKKKGMFLPQFDPGFQSPAFYKNYRDKISYFACTPSFTENDAAVSAYASHLLTHFGNRKSVLHDF